MQQIEKECTLPLSYPLSNYYTLSDLLFFDIETTGFQAAVSSLYLIGCSYYDGESFQIKQWFADEYQNERLLLTAFFEFASSYSYLIHYNGNGFDIPYLIKKIQLFELPYSFDHFISIDLYKKLTPYKKVFCLDNYKQKTVEQFLHINRTDQYSGGELIQVYGDYLKAHFKQNTQEEQELKSLLLLHNEDDLLGMLQLTDLFFYTDLFEQKLSSYAHTYKGSISQNLLLLEATFSIEHKASFHWSHSLFSLVITPTKLMLSVPVYEGELKYYYPNYKDYYYLPSEDTAIHKSVATYVEKEYKQKAKPSTCYTRKHGRFLPQGEEFQLPKFSVSPKDYITYFLIEEEKLTDSSFLEQYMTHLLHLIPTFH